MRGYGKRLRVVSPDARGVCGVRSTQGKTRGLLDWMNCAARKACLLERGPTGVATDMLLSSLTHWLSFHDE
jgi:hypothetical protein